MPLKTVTSPSFNRTGRQIAYVCNPGAKDSLRRAGVCLYDAAAAVTDTLLVADKKAQLGKFFWNEAGDRSWLDEDASWTRSYSGNSASTNDDDEASAEYSLFDPFGYGEGAGISGTYVTVPAFERALLVDLATAFTPVLNPSSLLPTADEASLDVRLSCTPCVVLDYHDAYKFKLGEES